MEDVLARTQVPRTALPDLLEKATLRRGGCEEAGFAKQIRRVSVAAVATVQRVRSLVLSGIACPMVLAAQADDLAGYAYPADLCPSCASWNAPQSPFRIFGNTYYVGTRGLSAILITADQGHVLIDGALPESAAAIAASVVALGFRIEDVKLILNSHAHFDHAGGIAALQRASGARVAASPASAPVLETGKTTPSDPQHGLALSFPGVPTVRVLGDGDTLRVGPVALVAHFTPGHTPGGTSWSWRSCEGERCVSLVYVDSQTPVSADDFHFTRSRAYPTAIADFERSFALIERLPCDVVLTPHPGATGLWERLAVRDRDASGGLIDAEGCRRYAASARELLARRIAAEAEGLPR